MYIDLSTCRIVIDQQENFLLCSLVCYECLSHEKINTLDVQCGREYFREEVFCFVRGSEWLADIDFVATQSSHHPEPRGDLVMDQRQKFRFARDDINPCTYLESFAVA